MRGIACITPSSHVPVTSEVPRIVEGSFQVPEQIRKRSYTKRKVSGLASVTVEDFTDIISSRKQNVNLTSLTHPLNLLWVSGCTQPGWNGFINISTNSLRAMPLLTFWQFLLLKLTQITRHQCLQHCVLRLSSVVETSSHA